MTILITLRLTQPCSWNFIACLVVWPTSCVVENHCHWCYFLKVKWKNKYIWCANFSNNTCRLIIWCSSRLCNLFLVWSFFKKIKAVVASTLAGFGITRMRVLNLSLFFVCFLFLDCFSNGVGIFYFIHLPTWLSCHQLLPTCHVKL